MEEWNDIAWFYVPSNEEREHFIQLADFCKEMEDNCE